ncbi:MULTISPECIES: S1 family peptidase [Nocardia]|uniref:Serine protease n=2 Tax=Nocardia TaxID=1817 RepID=A0A2T2ZAD5_9NOCA|nr:MULTISPECIES: serine protease [Nocardia]MBF6449205.1 serine protease [Nocardia elegans]PSR64703.1 serine protease [Nocardia nova]
MKISPRRAAGAVAAALACALVPTTAAQAVVGGVPISAANYPWLAAIGTPAYATRPGGQFCAGALIAPDRVLTAAHCGALARTLPGTTVTFGRTDVAGHGGVTVGIADVRIDPAFRVSLFGTDLSYHHNVAVLVLSAPVALPTVAVAAPQGATATVVGWGATSEDDQSNSVLRAATVPLVSDTACAVAYGAEFDPGEALCAGSPAADTGEFDSGGPLLVDGKIVGVTSWGKGAAEPGFPGVYARVPALDF